MPNFDKTIFTTSCKKGEIASVARLERGSARKRSLQVQYCRCEKKEDRSFLLQASSQLYTVLHLMFHFTTIYCTKQ